MKLIFTHVNSNLPEYIQYNFIQNRLLNPTLDISIVCHKNKLSSKSYNYLLQSNIQLIPYEDLEQDDLVQEFRKISWYKVWGIPDTKYPSPLDFVQGTTERLYALNAYLSKIKINDVFHSENDVLCYTPILDIYNIVKNNFAKLSLTKMGNQDHTFSFVYIPTPKTLYDFCVYNLEKMKLGDQHLRRIYHMDMVHEMSIAKIYEEETNQLDFFPILKTDNTFSFFNSLFDPASYGQYLGGTNNHGLGPGYAGAHHIIGREILNNRHIPYISTNGTPYVENIKLNTLHIHSKQLQNFLLRDI
ncbi:MAG: hypothetical protein WC346_15830 [Methanogenium sp.]|jgi:hypothetical protein